MSRALIAAVIAALPSLAAASSFSWHSPSGPTPIHFDTLTTSPGPLTTDGNALPFRFDLSYDTTTNLITATDISLGVPTAAAGFYLSFPTGGQVGSFSTSFPTPIPAGPAGPFSADVTNPDGSRLTFTGSDNAASPVSSLAFTIEKKILGVWVQIPSLDTLGTPATTPSWLTNGDYYARLQLFDDSHSTLFDTEIYFSNNDGSVAPIHFIPVTPVPTPAAALAALPLLCLTASHHLRTRRTPRA